MKRVVFNTCLASLLGGVMAIPAAAQSGVGVGVGVGVAAQGHFTFELGTPGFRVPVEGKLIKGAPFSADIVTESIQTLSDGNRIVQRSTTRFYRDSAGRVRREEERGTGSPAISITDPVAGRSYSLDPDNRTAQQTTNMMAVHVNTALQRVFAINESMTITREPFNWTRRPADEIRVQNLPERTIEGVRAQGVRRTTTIAAGAIGNELPIEIVSEEWTSPDLKVLVLTEHRDPRMGTSTYRVTNINRAEPDAYLFEVPADYTVTPSTEGLKRIQARPVQPR
jgi:hypothetical protein